MTHPVLERRRAGRAARVEAARGYANTLAGELDGLVAVVVIGSVARGDWNQWSDIDTLVIAESLPPDGRARLERTVRSDHPGVQGVAWTPGELVQRRQRRDPMAVEADEVGVTVWGRLPPQAES